MYVCMYMNVCVCVYAFSNIISSETTGPIEAKSSCVPPWDGGTKVCSNGPGHLTKMAIMWTAMPLIRLGINFTTKIGLS